MQSQAQLPSKLVLKGYAATSWLPLVAFFPLVITLFVFGGMALTDGVDMDGWRTPLLGIGGMSFGVFILAALFDLALRAWEIRNIRRVYADVWAVFPQYKTEAAWQRFVEKDHEEALEAHHFEWAPLIIITVVVGAFIGWWLMSDNEEAEVFFGLAGFWVIVAGLLVSRWLRDTWNINARYQRRHGAPAPNYVISRTGAYHEDEGFESLRRIESLEWKEATKSRPAKMIFTARISFVEEWLTNNEHSAVQRWYIVEVPVLKDDETKAAILMQRFKAEHVKG
jgi:hypothetical protein